ncbi:DUF1992 domain-containing protein [Paucibacter sp. APW11]|uniref:DUF1992 domain-containing protein n=1 Tax=Roseateles aquae TaxID=3077235 RepID=A0ABU3PB86_9BURK|nr:DnaJ family domain-containing protein [Paucibacter sp. APW11]MDT8999026.1 DUF1992 domain-containing protein [Paucibacter sp. APW11]
MQDEEIALHLQQALQNGELKQAESFGKPLAEDAGWEATPEGLRMPFKILKNSGYAPPEVDLFKQRAALAAELQLCADEAQRQALRLQLSELEQKLALRMESLRAHARL